MRISICIGIIFLKLLIFFSSILPLVLAQLLIQFQKPIITDTTSITNITSEDTTLNRVTREALIYDNNNYNQTNGNLIDDQRLPLDGKFKLLILLILLIPLIHR